MESAGVLSRKYYVNFAPTKSAEAIRKAGCQLFCCEDMVIMGKLGNGYFASVFLVHHHPTDRFMAMKLTKEASAHRREIELLSKLNHKNVIKLFGSCVIGARFACLTELANGGNLSSLLSAEHVDLPWPVRIGLALDIASGLQHLHSHNLIHRDLSSANILIQITFPEPSTDDLKRLSLSPTASSIPFDPAQLLLADIASPNGKQKRADRMGDVAAVDAATLLPPHEELPFSPGHRVFTTPIIPPIWMQPIWESLAAASKPVPRYTAVVADLGLCLDLSRVTSEPTPLVGNPYYIAPECLTERAPCTYAADVFAFGLLVCELATRLVNDGNLIPRTQDFGLDLAQLPTSPDCPSVLIQAAADACKVDNKKRAKLPNLITRLSTELDRGAVGFCDHHQPDGS